MDYDFDEESRETTPEESKLLFQVEQGTVYPICGYGTSTNLISLSIVFRPQMKSPMSCCLQILAAFDTLFLLSYIFMVNDVAAKYFRMLFYIALTGSVWTVVLLSLMRFIGVCHPLKARSLFTCRRIILSALFITVCAIFTNIPRQFLLERYFTLLGFETDSVVYAQTRFSQPYWMILSKREINFAKSYGWFEVAVLFCIPLVLSGFFTISTAVASKKLVKEPRIMISAETAEEKLSMTVFAIVILFFMCSIPPLIFISLYYNGILRLRVHIITCIFMVPLLTRSAVNFLIYCALGGDFWLCHFGIFKNSFLPKKEVERDYCKNQQ